MMSGDNCVDIESILALQGEIQSSTLPRPENYKSLRRISTGCASGDEVVRKGQSIDNFHLIKLIYWKERKSTKRLKV